MRPLIKARQNDVFVSAASCWEIAIKVRSGKWTEASGLVPGIAGVLTRARLNPLPVTVQHAERAGLLNLAHNDPFDRLLAAQALEEGLVMASIDPVFRQIAGLTVV
jgi:PIN domain nuclease of toxin-antitoxin system